MSIVGGYILPKPDVIGFSCYIWNIEETIMVMTCSEGLPDAKIVLGGPEVSYDTELLDEAAELRRFHRDGRRGRDVSRLAAANRRRSQKYHFVFGIAYRKDEQVIITPARPKLDLNVIPSPHRFEEDISSSCAIASSTSRRAGAVRSAANFACPVSRSAFAISIWSGSKSDLLYLIDNGAKLIKFVDRTFNIKRDYAMEIFRFLIDNHRGCVFQFEITADIMRPEVLDYLGGECASGRFRFEIGVQSTNDPTNDRGATPAELHEAVRARS